MAPDMLVKLFASLAVTGGLVGAIVSAMTLQVVAGWLAVTNKITNGRKVAAWAAWWRAGSLIGISAMVVVASVTALTTAAHAGTPEVFRAATLLCTSLLVAGGALADTWERKALVGSTKEHDDARPERF